LFLLPVSDLCKHFERTLADLQAAVVTMLQLSGQRNNTVRSEACVRHYQRSTKENSLWRTSYG